MTNEERMSFWKGGNPSNVLIFTNPYNYKDCIIGISTDGRAVYDYNKVLDFIYEQDKDNYDINDFQDEEDMEYSIYQNAADMLNYDLRTYRPDRKVPVFCRLEIPYMDEQYMIISEYDFSSCVIGQDFREDRFIYSLSKMVDLLTENHGFTKEDAVKYVYSLRMAGTVARNFFYYVIVDDLFEKMTIDFSFLNENPKYATEYEKIFRRLNDQYSPELEENCLEFDGKTLLSVLKKMDTTFVPAEYNPAKLYLHCAEIEKLEASKVLFSVTNSQVVLTEGVQLKKESSFEKSIYLPDPFVNFLTLKIKEDDTVQISEKDGVIFVKTQKDLFSVQQRDMDFYPDYSDYQDKSYPLKAEIKRSLLEDLWNWILENDDNSQAVLFTFADNTLTIEYEGFKKTESSACNFKEDLTFTLRPGCVNLLRTYFETDFTLELDEAIKLGTVNQDEKFCLFMIK